MFSHVTVGANDLDVASMFYDAVLLPLGLQRREITPDGGPSGMCWVVSGESLPRFYVYKPFNGEPATAGNGGMVAFVAPSPEAVEVAYEAGLQSGGRDEGKPGLRPRYGDGYYGAYLRDPEGNKIHIVYRGDI